MDHLKDFHNLSPCVRKAVMGLGTSPHPYAQKIVNQFLRAQEIIGVSPEKNITDLLDGDIRLGYVTSPELVPNESNVIYGIRQEDTPKNVLITGISGSGKSNLLLTALADIVKLHEPVTVIALDFKGEFRHCYNFFKYILNEDEMLFNPYTMISAPIKRFRGQTPEVTNTRNRHVDQPIQELVHVLTP